MDNEMIICSNCSTENEEKYDYCKNCGTKLEKKSFETENDFFSETVPPKDSETYENGSQNANYSTQQNYSQYYNQTYPNGNTYVYSINGIPYGEVSVFIGQKAPKYMNTFAKMEILGSKTAWHWPTAILSFFLGPLGAALWFFYRKMYKPALILSIIGVIVTVISAIIIGPVDLYGDIIDILSGVTQPETLESATLNETTLRTLIANLLSGSVSLGALIICGLFTHGWYKQHIHNTILKYRSSNVDMRYYQMGLMSIGGTSGGMLALGIAIIIFAENITSIIFSVISLL